MAGDTPPGFENILTLKRLVSPKKIMGVFMASPA